ncbi:MAG: class I SAM-dependent DNA methyltransferase [Parachlamydiales bacterium]
MNISKIEENIREVLSDFSRDTFIYDLLGAFGKPKASIARLQKGSLNLSKKPGEIIWKKNLYFKKVEKGDLYSTLDQVSQNQQIRRHNPRFLIVSDYQTLLAIDTTTTDKLDISINELPENFDFFLPLSGIEKASIHKENAADVKAAERMAKIYEEICKFNPNMRPKHKDAVDLNVFLSRLLFCFFAESTEIFKSNQFIETINERTQEDGSDLQEFFDDLFDLLNKRKSERTACSKWVRDFPYVNGGLFKDRFKIPKFTQRLRKMIIESGRLDWSSINPDIFGSMIQSVIDPDQRSCLGMHYTSVTNIMKVIQPLFLDDLYQELEKSKNHKRRLEELCDRLGKIKIFDPACGSGNFLIIAYKELRRFEIQLLKHLELLGKHPTFLSQVQLSQFYGIEIDEFACQIARLSLWLAEHQMNMIFKKIFGESAPSLPLKEGGHIVYGNATRLDWEKICPKNQQAEIYLASNPPYIGARMQTEEQKEDISFLFQGRQTKPKKIDYVICWFLKASDYVRDFSAKYAFVSTNSICQGEQAPVLTTLVLQNNLEIYFAHQSFKWTNNAKGKAGVTCVIVGIRNISPCEKYLYDESTKKTVKNINPYLEVGNNKCVLRKSIPLSNLPKMDYGNMAIDGGHLILSAEEKTDLIRNNPRTKRLIKSIIGAQEFIKGVKRWCLWIEDHDLNLANEIDFIKYRVKQTKTFRLSSSDKGTHSLASKAHQFREMKTARSRSLLIPTVTSERREYIPIGFLTNKEVIIAPNQAIYDPEPYVFGIVSSRMHMTWVRAVAGRLKTDYRYSSELCYNTFPFPEINKKQKEQIHSHVLNVLSEREKYPEKTIAELYDPKKMPAGLRKAHQNLDAAVERCYRSKPFESDEERLEHLFKLYEEMIQNENKRK